jgi:multiple sugar transport system substrate-binding protein
MDIRRPCPLPFADESKMRVGILTLLILLASCSPGTVVLRIGLFAGNTWGVPSGDSYRFLDSAIADYQALHRNVRIVYRPGTLKEDYSEWLAQNLVKGTEPDLFDVLTGDFNSFASIGAMEDLDRWIDRSPDFSRKAFYGTALESGQFQGRQLALALEVAPNLMFVNTTLLHRVGIADPKEDWTWDDFYRICQAVTKVRGDGVPDSFGTNRLSWRSFSIANGAIPWDVSGIGTSFSSSSFEETIAFISKVQKLNRHQDVPPFDSGKVAFSAELWTSFRAYGYYPYRVNRFSQFHWIALPMPRGPHGRGNSELLSSLMAISSRSAHKALAWDFLKFLTANLKSQENLVRYSYGWPVLKAASRTGLLEAALKDGEQGREGVAVPRVIDSIIEESVVTPRFRKFEEATAIADRELYRIIDDPYDLQDRLLALDKSMKEFLK